MAIKCCDITAGKLRSRIIIQRQTKTADGEGGFTDDGWNPDPADGVRAMVSARGGSERFFSERNTPGNRYRIVIRWRGDANGAPYYNIGDRVIYQGRTLGITSAVDVEDAQRYIEIMAEENKAS